MVWQNIKKKKIIIKKKTHKTQAAVKTCFIRGSTVRFMQLPPGEVDKEILIEATKREMQQKTS